MRAGRVMINGEIALVQKFKCETLNVNGLINYISRELRTICIFESVLWSV